MLERLIELIDKNCNNVDKDMVKKAYYFADKAHKKQKRESGEPYIMHPVEVACILAEMGLDTGTIVAGLLHDVIEDTNFNHEDVSREFSPEVANLVEGVTKLGKIEYKTKEEQQADNVRKMLLAMADDIRVILIKLADRLHNMRTLKYLPVEKQKEKAKETFDIYAPLAHRLGMSKIKWELEDLAFRYINQNEYYFIVRKIAEKRVEREKYIDQIIKQLKENLKKAGIESDIEGRPKHFYSIYRKMVKKNKTIDQIFDLTAVRILVDNVKDCYASLGIAHTIYKPIPGRFKDYIAMPKPNMYQSLHSTVIGPQGKPFEIQIRTFEMHKTAEYGIAAHWKYKEGVETANDIDKKLTWLREMLEWQRETSDAEEFMERFKIDLFSDEVFVFTPKGTVINLPYEATPIDFAYKIHTDIGNSCIGAKVSGKMVPLDYHLKTGEIVEILVSSTPKGPSIDWLNVVKSNQAKSKIRSWFKKAKREENILKGKELLEKETKKQGYNFGEIAKGEIINSVLKKYNMNSLDDLYASVGVGGLNPSTIVLKMKDMYIQTTKMDIDDWKKIKDKLDKFTAKPHRKRKDSPGVIVKGETNVLVRFAKCCNPVPGDFIIGYITKGRGVSIHRRDCKNIEFLLKNKNNKVVDVSWGKPKGEYITEIKIEGDDRQKLLSELMDIINDSKICLYAVNAKPVRGGIAVIDMKLKISSIDELKDVMRKLRKVKGVKEVYRTKN
ncbi:RelA/SpoT family protein [Clostridium luticellarii]|uniref:GTP diphosphokinase n=1 Tax=Clostridium luticellarii TaxID=1691940 RepID=A0A2T0BLM2_9CLOT|nr:bifunctional (p)ppGpp synthetase/guanosine-3',5'-bis(diphosphate) 3'-pyrophosphohydrolase [Clostridium luticellarii]MCI1944288.1 bifunctional (p)ppGpp synthetase/guanosine-3',5'-bis(diphosphate) 3'-pyrophosphohydrolase [Clostridium luticellarii]MCI1967784.1 bifunctional (p)ppGpp synthetase/guanosine-3',5'-bis(diphosphate) 3'-pyrophosphohydrolase [Clostridium luticellarii]MCI1994662.1 bifunctional (p)ppGpp synthetase/guanosine-3',5'-bis(diphosphate) 3'-pyrophosphohydrolase [Clostridium luticel